MVTLGATGMGLRLSIQLDHCSIGANSSWAFASATQLLYTSVKALPISTARLLWKNQLINYWPKKFLILLHEFSHAWVIFKLDSPHLTLCSNQAQKKEPTPLRAPTELCVCVRVVQTESPSTRKLDKQVIGHLGIKTSPQHFLQKSDRPEENLRY